VKILLADDHALFRAGLCDILRQFDERVEIVEAGTCAEMLSALSRHTDLALALVDLGMPDGDGLTAIMHIAEAPPVVVLSASEKREDMERALREGALGFMPKSITPAVLLAGLHLVLAGGRYVPRELAHAEIEASSVRGADALHGFTRRQLDVLSRIVDGKTNKAIARELGLSEYTVRSHATKLFRSLNVNNRTQAVAAARDLGIPLLKH